MGNVGDIVSVTAQVERYPGSEETGNTKATPHNKPDASDLLGQKIFRTVATSVWVRNSRESTRRTGFLQLFLGVRWGRAFQGRDWWDFKSRAWNFYSAWWGQGLVVRAVRALCEWNLAVGGRQGRCLATQGLPGARSFYI